MPVDCKGEDSLEHQQVKSSHLPLTHPIPPMPVLGKQKLPPYPYCLKCHNKDLGMTATNAHTIGLADGAGPPTTSITNAPSPTLLAAPLAVLSPSTTSLLELCVPPP
jgi:hypothetical protein